LQSKLAAGDVSDNTHYLLVV